LDYISAAESIFFSRKLPNSVKLRGGWSYYAVQGHPRSPSLVPTLANVNSRSLKMFKILHAVARVTEIEYSAQPLCLLTIIMSMINSLSKIVPLIL